MNRSQLWILSLFIAGLAVMLLFPPYFAMDQTSDGGIHGFLGYHPAWKEPDQERAYAILLEGGVLPDSGGSMSDLTVRRNMVRLTLNALVLLVLFLVCFLWLRARSGTGAGSALAER